MQANHPMTGPGYFHWNAGGWFGSQLGGTSWLLVGAAVLAPRAPIVAVDWFAGFVRQPPLIAPAATASLTTRLNSTEKSP